MKKGFPIRLTIDEAIEVFSKPDIKPFSKDKLRPSSFNEIKTFKDAVRTLGLNLDWVSNIISEIEIVSKATAAMFKLNIIKKALDLEFDSNFIKNSKNPYIYYPYIPCVSNNSTYFENLVDSGELEVIGEIKYNEEKYSILGGSAVYSGSIDFKSNNVLYYIHTNIELLGCTKIEIAKHFGKYFGVLIAKAKYGDLSNFEVIKDKYNNL